MSDRNRGHVGVTKGREETEEGVRGGKEWAMAKRRGFKTGAKGG